jgi:uncharacterized protein YbcI
MRRDVRVEHAPGAPSPLLDIANAMVHLYKETFGRGPTRARAHFSGPDTLTVLLEDTLTVAERRLVSLGEHERVRADRLCLQLALEDIKRAEVERILSRRTIAAICGIDPSRDVAAEVFMLAPAVEPSEDGFGHASPSPPRMH